MTLMACDGPPTSSADSGIPGHGTASIMLGSCAKQNPIDESLEFKPFWDCGKQISVSAASAIQSTVNSALEVWRPHLKVYRHTQLPQFQDLVSGSGGDVEIVVASGASGTVWCGETNPAVGDPSRITITLKTAGCNGNKGSQSHVLLHELGHALGWTSGAHKPNGADGHSDNCVMHLPDDFSLNATICAHEIEGMLARYSIRSDIDPANFWNRDFVYGTNTDRSPRTLGANGTVQLTAGMFLTPTGNETWPTSTQVWQSNAPGVATVSGTGFVAAVANGTTHIRVSATANPASHYLPYWLLDRGDSIQVTVSIPVDTFLRVNDISFPRMLPIYVADSFNLTALIAGDGGQGGVTVSWVILYSNNILPNDSTPFLGGTSYFLRVPAGSYRITAKAYPKQGSKVSSRAEMELTVCPAPGGGGGGDAIRVPVPPGGETDAVGGC